MLRLVRDQLVQVFLNLILNAMDATGEGGTIEICTSLSDGWIRAEVATTGTAFPRQTGAIFQPYFTTKETGTGLGLFVCKHVLEQSPDWPHRTDRNVPAGARRSPFC